MENISDEEKLKQILIQQANITCFEIATFCADLCDKHRGDLRVGYMIREHFGLDKMEKTIPKREDKKDVPKSYLRRVK